MRVVDDAARPAAWWADAVIYQIYLRSFADGNGDGIGDLIGLRARLPYLQRLGVDALWLTPWYPSPWVDGGYDVADYFDVDERFGGLAEAQRFIEEAHRHRMRVIIDIVPNHTSDQHEWFRAALAAGPGSPERARYWFRPGSGPDGSQPPNDWCSVFGGPAWSRVTEAEGSAGEWYLHLFAPEQPDLNWDDASVRAGFEQVLRFWLDRGVDGFRIDVAHALAKDPSLPDLGTDAARLSAMRGAGTHPHWDRDEVLDVYRAWRQLIRGHDAVFVAEAWVGASERLVRYLGDDLLHTAFNFDLLTCAWEAESLRGVIDTTLRSHASVGAPPTWVLANHDVPRAVTRLGREETGLPEDLKHELYGTPTDLVLGYRRARAAALLMLALPGSVYIYQGEELGLWEVEDLPHELLQDPIVERTGGRYPGRDGCRVPLPWAHDEPAFGFLPAQATGTPWLPQPAAWAGLAADVQERDPGSMLSLYRQALALRRQPPLVGDSPLTWRDGDARVLAFSRGERFTCVVNLADRPVDLPPSEVLLSSEPLLGDDRSRVLPVDGAVWLAT